MRAYRHRSWRIEWYIELSTTMERAAELAEAGEEPGAVIVADNQTSGRGTHGRLWSAPPRTCLTFTVYCRPEITVEDLEKVPGRVARAVLDTIKRWYGIDGWVKAPNDVVTRNGKLCGVLCTSRIHGGTVSWLTCGVGINTSMTRDQLPTDSSTSLALELGAAPDNKTLLHQLLDSLEFLLPTDETRQSWSADHVVGRNGEPLY